MEEFIRLYPLVFMDGRLVTRDIDFHGLHMRKGEIVWLGLARAFWPPKGLARLRTSSSTGVLKVTSLVGNNYNHELCL